MQLTRTAFWNVVLKLTFIIMLVGRFLYPFIENPMGKLWSDPARHWHNAKHFWSPEMFGSIDPKLYQLWLWGVGTLSDWGARLEIISLFSGALCALLPWLWYKAARELLCKEISLLFALVVGTVPSLLVIYGFFMTETLLLVLMALAVWLTLRARRKKTFGSFILASFVWVLASFTRSVALPFAGLSILYMLFVHRHKFRLGLTVLCMYAALALPAGWHSYQQLQVFAPFGFTYLSKIYHKADHVHIRFVAGKKHWQFASPSYFVDFLHPVGSYSTYRNQDSKTPYQFQIDTRYGARDWQQVYDKVSNHYGWEEYWKNTYENAIFLVFSPSWPDYIVDREDDLIPLYHARWLWAVLVIASLLWIPCARHSEKRQYIVSMVWVVLLLFFFQQSGVMEGRYRKPIEPFLLLAAFCIFVKESGDTQPFFTGMYRLYITPNVEWGRELLTGFRRRSGS